MTKRNSQNLGQSLEHAAALHRGGQLDEAAQNYRAILRDYPQEANALHLLGVIHLQRGDVAGAAALMGQAITENPRLPGLQANIAKAYRSLKDFRRAEWHLRSAIEQDPRNAEIHKALAALYQDEKRYRESASALEKVVALKPDAPREYLDFGKMLRNLDDFAGILSLTERALAIFPDNPDLRVLRSEALFAVGRLTEGWEYYEARFFVSTLRLPRTAFSLPEWEGEDLTGKSIVICREQGLGDEILHASMYSELASCAARCVVTCVPRLLPLFRRSFPHLEVMTPDAAAEIVAGFDFKVSAGSLGRWLRRSFAAFPRKPYLQPDQEMVARLRDRYGAGSAQPFLIGVAWRSVGVEYASDKSIDLGHWGAILSLPGVRFVSLQYGDCDVELQKAREAFGVDIIADPAIDATGDIDVYAAQVAAMDLVIASSNTAAHVAGALGVSVLCMVPQTLGLGRRWYWFAEQLDCPWYPALRCFVPQREGEWLDAIAEVALAAVSHIEAKSPTTKTPGYLLGLGKSYAKAGLPYLAAKALQAADARRPQQPQILYDWAMARKASGEPAEALGLFERAILLAPQAAELLHAKGLTLMELNRPAEAVEAYRTALRIAPDRAHTQNNVGSALRELGMADEAHKHYERAAAAMPDNPQVLLNLAASFSERGGFQQAIGVYDRLLTLHPGHPDVLYYKAQTLLGHCDLAEGWRLFAARLHCAQNEKIQDRLAHPLWNGQALRHRHALIWTEQGLGDEIMLASMIPDALAEARKITLLCSKRLVPLFQRSFPTAVVAERAAALPDAAFASDIDFQMSMSELGLLFRNDLTRFPRRKAFLIANANTRQPMRRRYEALAAGRKIVGISWKSNNPVGGALKSTELQRWLPLLTAPGVMVVDLQYGDTAEERALLERAHGITLVHDDEVDPMGDVDTAAAQIAAMDEVVSISNTTVHVAGALGVPTTMLLPLNRGRRWYWFRGRDRAVWYPSVTIRDFPDAEWDAVLAAVAAALRS